MVKIFPGVIAVVSIVIWPAWAAPRLKPQSPTVEEELKRMQGTWRYLSQSIGGLELNEKDRDRIWVEIEGERLTKTGAAGGGRRYKVVIDPVASPRRIDLVSIDHPSGKTFTHTGIYEWDGEFLRMCFDNTGVERPKEFKALEGRENIYLSVLKRRDK
ncbi:TIGR03067 domain-containing protein [Zavarzinella formosa]|uniref:TIGR03067 domain-containing protein n=1 Tax=Zavarzinella formosa TaxID=360055 RepID=UPI00036B65F9|nr:TIGR03067 domain-containing protein [Zavarzinella formosa]